MQISNEIKIGILAAVAIFVAIWGFKFLQGKDFLTSDQKFHAYYKYADQLNVSAPVFVKGLEVGTVTEIKFAPEREKPIYVEFQVDKDIRVHPSSTAYIVSTGVLGGKAVELSIRQACTGDECASSGDELKGDNKSLVSSMIAEDDLEKSIKQISEGFRILLDSIDHVIARSSANQGVGQVISDVQTTVKNLKEITGALSHQFNDTGSPFNQTLNNLSAVSQNLKENNGTLTDIIENLAEISENIKEIDTREMSEGVNQTIASSGEAIAQLKERIAQLESGISGFNATMAKIENGEGSLGKLIQDEEVYMGLNQSVNNLNLLLQDIRLNPDRYIKVSVFGKKSEPYTIPEKDPAFQD